MKRILISAAIVLVTALSVVLIVSATNASETKKAKTEVVKGSCCDTAKAATACDQTAMKHADCDPASCDPTKCDPATCTKTGCDHDTEACDKTKTASASASAEAKPCATKCGGH